MTPAPVITPDDLRRWRPGRDFFVGIDSDGCVFDTMELKQKRCFHPVMIEQWGLQAIAPRVRQAAEFVNLYSRWRGQNRYVNLLRVMTLLRNWPAATAATDIPTFPALTDWVASGQPLSLATLRQATADGNPELAAVLAWSERVDQHIETLPPAMPFPGAVESLGDIGRAADAMVVSQTPAAALLREWSAAGLCRAVRAIAGQEIGSKTRQIRLATEGRYAPGAILMIGDAPGDAEAARAADALFYPIVPGAETASWEHFRDVGFARFLEGRFTGDYAESLATAFYLRLPEQPPW